MAFLKLSEILQLGTFVVTCITAVTILLTYRRNKKIELENHLFKLKIGAYSDIIYEIEKLFSKMRVMIYYLEKSTNNCSDDSDLDSIATEVDELVRNCDLIIIKNSIYFSVKTIENLGDFSKRLYGSIYSGLTFEEILVNLKEYFDSQLLVANEANSKMRDDLKIDQLTESLFKRY